MKKKNGKQNSRGAVTVFLTMVLIPCMIFTCAFGDVSRVQLSKSQAVASADLALYSLMANYDEDLKEWYGLVASCQDINQFYDVTENYFIGMMSAKGLSDTASGLFVSYLDALRSGGDFTDFLQVEVVGETKVEAKGGAAMGSNPALIEDGIVEFMKYRGPVEIVVNLFDRFKNLRVQETLEDASKDKPIVDAKQKAAEAEGEVLSEVLYTYIELTNYTNYYQKNDKLRFENFQNKYPDELDFIREDYKPITELITKYYTFTKEIENMVGKIPVRDLPQLSPDGKSVYYSPRTFTFETIGATENRSQVEGEDGEEEEIVTYSISDSALNNIIQNYETYINNIKSAADAVAESCNGIAVPVWGTGEEPTNGVNPARYYAQVQNALVSGNNIGDITSNADYLMAVYAEIILAEQCEMTNPGVWQTKLAEVKSRIEDTQRNYLSYYDATTPYEQAMKQYQETVSGQTYDVFDYINKSFKYQFGCQYNGAKWDGAQVTVGEYLEDVRTEYMELYDNICHQLDSINTIVNGGTTSWNGKDGYKVVSLDELKATIEKYQKARDAWGDAAEKGDTPFADSERDEYNNPDQHNDSPMAAPLLDLNPEDVDELKTRLLNIQKDLQDMKTALESFTYGEETIYNMAGRNAVIAAGKTKVPSELSQVDPYLSKNVDAASGYYQSLIKPPQPDPVYTAPQLDNSKAGNHPDLQENICELYRFMQENINQSELDKITKEKDAFDSERGSAEKKAGEAAEGSKDYDTSFLARIGEDPGTHGHSAETFNGATALDSAVSVVKKILSGNLDEFRDQLYVCEYIMDMFSHSAYDNQGQYRLAKKSEGVQHKFKDLSQDNKFKGYPESYKNEWCGTEGVYIDGVQMLTKFDNQSLTNRPISPDNNKSNLAEIEYILYGKGTNEENLEAAYKDIFVIREALNLVAGFQCFYFATKTPNLTAEAISGIAGSIQMATCGIVPIPLTKCVIIGVLATLESAYDLYRLKAGIPVVLYKKEIKQWRYAIKPGEGGGGSRYISDLLKSLDLVDEPIDDNGLIYSDYMYIFLAISANSSSTYKQMLLRVGDLIEANMIKGGTHGGSFDLDLSCCYFQLTSKLKVKPLLISLPIVSSMEGVNVEQTQESQDWCTYEVKVTRGYS